MLSKMWAEIQYSVSVDDKRMKLYSKFFINASKISIFHVNRAVKWLDGTCGGEEPVSGTLRGKMEPSSAN